MYFAKHLTSMTAAALAAALASVPAGAQRDTTRVVTLDEAVAAALRADPAAVAAAAGVSDARAQRLQATGAFLPTVTLNGTYGNSSNERFDQATGRLTSESYTAQLQTGLEIFDGGRRFAERRSAGAAIDAAEAGVVEQRFQTALVAKQAYFQAAAATELLSAAGQRLERARQQMAFARTRLELGTATRSDALRAELEVGNAELAVVEAEAALRTARQELGRRMGVPYEVRPSPEALPQRAPALPADEALAARAAERSPSVAAARARTAQRRASRFAAYTSYAPTLRANFGYDWASIEFPPSERDWSLRVTASLPVLNGFAREGNVSRARSAERVAEAAARDAELAARARAADAARTLRAAERRVEIARRAVELAREDLRVQEERYRLGNATILDLQTSQEALAEADAAWVTARQALGVAVAQLEAVLGEELSALDGTTPPDAGSTTSNETTPGND